MSARSSISNSGLMQSTLLFLAAALSLLTALTLLPVLCTRGYHWYPFPLFAFMSLFAFLTSGAALAVAVVAWVTAVNRFEDAGFSAKLIGGPCVSSALWLLSQVKLTVLASIDLDVCRGYSWLAFRCHKWCRRYDLHRPCWAKITSLHL